MVPIIREFAQKNGLKYKADGLIDMFSMHFRTLRRNALSAASEVPVNDSLRPHM
jgi:hypothetical protein